MTRKILSFLGRKQGTPALDRALEAWRGRPHDAGRLSPGTRERILAAARQPARRGDAPAGLASLFVPARRVALAAAVPSVLAALSLALFLMAAPGHSRLDLSQPVRLEAHKVGGEVVFVIANGGRPHRVVRTESPLAGATGSEIPADGGAFKAPLSENANLVFYRID